MELRINLENCYGIKKLEYKFQFIGNNRTFSIYSSNGLMKTSFAKTFDDISMKNKSKDLIFSERSTIRGVSLNGEKIVSSQIFVIHSYNEGYNSKKMSTLLANKELRNENEKIYKKINNNKNILLQGLKKVCKVSSLDEIEKQISKVFCSNKECNFFEALEAIKEVNFDKVVNYKGIKYKDIFENKVKDFLNNMNIKDDINEYIEQYDKLLDDSCYFKKGIFNHSQAEDTAKQLKNNGFFEAKHEVLLSGKKISTEEELLKIISTEKEKILASEILKEAFNKLDKKITKNAGLKVFRNFLSNNNFIIAELQDLENFEKKLWKYYIKENKDSFNDLMETYKESKINIKKISEKAKKEKTKWLKAINVFNERFVVPFEVTIGNKVDVILENKIPSIVFKFVDNDKQKNIKKEYLLEVLSQGEKRALYLLDIIFEIEARKITNERNLFIIDDISDSFDYKNKYAIIEYLKEISQIDNFYQIILSHNFDFHRTVSSRLLIQRKNRLVAKKQENTIIFKEEVYQNNPFVYWIKNLNDSYKIIACIPFVRNLAEYSGNDDVYKELTSFLHIKEDSCDLTLKKLKEEFDKILKNIEGFNEVDNFLNFLNEAVTNIDKNTIELERKITLAIAIRLEAEKFIIRKIGKSEITKNQTAKLIDEYNKKYQNETNTIKILNKVQLMTPESIHINSFMYEPLLDMSGEYLIKLYQEISDI
jgi:ABC-type cobalamin/Fe3+-siderophores transport system ATPase subunit